MSDPSEPLVPPSSTPEPGQGEFHQPPPQAAPPANNAWVKYVAIGCGALALLLMLGLILIFVLANWLGNTAERKFEEVGDAITETTSFENE